MLQKLGFLPGFNKQVTSTGGEKSLNGTMVTTFVLDMAHLKK